MHARVSHHHAGWPPSIAMDRGVQRVAADVAWPEVFRGIDDHRCRVARGGEVHASRRAGTKKQCVDAPVAVSSTEHRDARPLVRSRALGKPVLE